ncbi:MAG: TolC family protein [Candidatus Binatus sp.]|uniref:TolC family protein n=1 Tax=Candidatus Binatus sp. TaxID=2811406 RepID=UPI002720A8BA|nr:TolC family protein [Candidatus Binatus sp.]MDO8433783.1 TolC family protein [Candidatus Binatus sp.]
MLRKKSFFLALLILPLQILPLLLIGTRSGIAQDSSLKVTGELPKTPLPPPNVTGPIRRQAMPVGPQEPPRVSIPPSAANEFEHHDSFVSLPSIFANQWSLSKQVPPETLISERYMRSSDPNVRGLTLKEAIYIALKNNPGLAASAMDPVASTETIRQANGTFDPNLTALGDITKTVVPVTSALQAGGGTHFVQKYYDWNFGINKVSSLTNGTWGVTFNNTRALNNSIFAGVNPAYNPSLTLSLSQPLLQNFGWKFATINVQIAESGQKQAQWNYGQNLQDFVQKIGGEYWNVVLAEENLHVARAALRFNLDLVKNNSISVKVGTLAPIDLQEAQSASATAEANVYTAEANLKNARTQLRQDVMLNPYATFLPAEIEPITRPNPTEKITVDEERALELAVQYRPSLGAMREAIRNALLQVKYSENQVLPQLNLGTQFGLNSSAGTAPCLKPFGTPTAGAGNCTPTGFPADSGARLPFGGIYGDALNRLWGFSFYSYAAVLTFQMPLDNAVPRAALAQARVQYEQQRLLYRNALSQAVVDVQSSLANLYADQKRASATAQATYYARESLHDEEIRFKVGMATTHDLLQFQEEEVSAQGNQVQAEVDLENAKLALRHANGTLLQAFQVNWEVQNPHEVPWYAAF